MTTSISVMVNPALLVEKVVMPLPIKPRGTGITSAGPVPEAAILARYGFYRRQVGRNLSVFSDPSQAQPLSNEWISNYGIAVALIW
jgi:hypothetical protein